MEEIKSVGIREFQANLHQYTRQSNPVAITSDGKRIGYYIPVYSNPSQQELASLGEAVDKIAHILKQHKVSEDDIIADFLAAKRNDSPL